MVKNISKIDYIRGKKYTFSIFRYYLNFRMTERMPDKVTSILEIGIRESSKHNIIIYYSITAEFTRQDGVIKINPVLKLENLIKERHIVKELLKKVEKNLN